jgi:EmrB/QacA subfamily drug resistance transporter
MDRPDIKRIALFLAVLAGFLTPFDLSAVSIAIPTMGGEFGMDAVMMSWVATAYLLAAAVFLVPFGRIADIYGRKKIFILGLSVFTFASFFLTLSISQLMIILLRLIQGSGGAMIFGTSVAILTEATPQEDRGKALGIYTTSVYLGLSTGPFLGGFLTNILGWRSIFLVNVPIGILAIAIILTKLNREWMDAEGEIFDLRGAFLYGLTLISVMYGFSLLPDLLGVAFIIIGSGLLVTFIHQETRTRAPPLLNLNLFLTNRVFAFSSLAALINYSATFAITFFMSFYLQYNKGLDPAFAGTILVSQPVVQAIFSSPAGKLSDRIEPAKIASIGMALTAIGLLSLAFLDANTSLIIIVAILVLIGFGFALFSSPNTNAIMSAVEKKYYGVASGTLGTMRLVGQMLSMGIAMIVLSVFVGRVEITPTVTSQLLTSIKVGFSIFTVLCLCGIFFSLVRGNLREKSIS